MREENERTLVIALVETAKGIANADEILSVSGVDVGWLGHYDLTDSMGIPAQFDRKEFSPGSPTTCGGCWRSGRSPPRPA